MPDVPLGGPNLASFGVLGPQEQAEAPVSGLDALIRGALKIGMIPGQVMQSQQPVTTQDLIKPAADMAMMTTLGAGAAPAEENALRMGIKAYHGSPHDFDRFDMGKIGTGEGAQAYGHGLYFAESEPVAKSYRDKLGQKTYEGKPVANYDYSGNVQFADGTSKQLTDAEWPKFRAEMEASKDPGHMYEVDINADPAHFLDWDKALADQPDVAAKLAQVAPGLKSGNLGQGAYRSAMGLSNSRDEGIAALRDAGIPGIKYLDQGSRPPRSLADTQASIDYYKDMLAKEPQNDFAKQQLAQYQSDLDKYGQGSHNYVVFDDSLISILRKYGLAGAIPTGAISSGLFDQNNQ